MLAIGAILLTGLPFFWGCLFGRWGKEKDTNQIESYLNGVLFLFFVQGVIFSIAVATDLSLSVTTLILGSVLLLSAVAGCFVWLYSQRRGRAGKRLPVEREGSYWQGGPALFQDGREDDRQAIWPWITLAVLLFLAQAAGILYYRPVGAPDSMVATVQTTLATDTLYQYHPLTGQPFAAGMLPSRKIVTLPLFYSFLCKIFSLPAQQCVYGLVSLAALFWMYLALARFYRVIFTGRGSVRKVWLCLVVTELLVMSGTYLGQAVGSMALSYGYRGSHLVVGILMPYLTALLYERFHWGGGKTQWRQAVTGALLCLAVSLFLSPVTEGLFFLLVTLAALALCLGIVEANRRFRCGK